MIINFSDKIHLSIVLGILALVVILLILLLIISVRNRKSEKAGVDVEKHNAETLGNAVRDLRADAENTRRALEESIGRFRKEITEQNSNAAETLNETLARRSTELGETLHSRFSSFTESLSLAAKTQSEALERALEKLREENSKKLDEMRGVVDEKLQSTLEKRLGESFKQVSERLENVYKSLGEMQSVSETVIDLKRVLTNVKTRGTWGEVQLGNLLGDFLAADQFVKNFKPGRGNEIVEFAIKLPGGGDDADAPLYLPIDSKFPVEDYRRIAEAAEKADSVALEAAAKAFATSIEKFANDIKDKYIKPPITTNFAVLFVPTDGIYAEILRRDGLAEKIQREKNILIAGPTTLAALVNSLKAGFQTLAIQKNSVKIGKTLIKIKKDFEKFRDALESVSKKLADAQKVVGDVSERHRIASDDLARAERLDLVPAEEQGGGKRRLNGRGNALAQVFSA